MGAGGTWSPVWSGQKKVADAGSKNIFFQLKKNTRIFSPPPPGNPLGVQRERICDPEKKIKEVMKAIYRFDIMMTFTSR